MYEIEAWDLLLQVPDRDNPAELKTLLDLRNALNALKGPLGNVPAFRKKIQSLLVPHAGVVGGLGPAARLAIPLLLVFLLLRWIVRKLRESQSRRSKAACRRAAKIQ